MTRKTYRYPRVTHHPGIIIDNCTKSSEKLWPSSIFDSDSFLNVFTQDHLGHYDSTLIQQRPWLQKNAERSAAQMICRQSWKAHEKFEHHSSTPQKLDQTNACNSTISFSNQHHYDREFTPMILSKPLHFLSAQTSADSDLKIRQSNTTPPCHTSLHRQYNIRHPFEPVLIKALLESSRVQLCASVSDDLQKDTLYSEYSEDLGGSVILSNIVPPAISKKTNNFFDSSTYSMATECQKSEPRIVEVWAHNLEEEFVKIRDVVEKYRYVAIDTEFPGVVAVPAGVCIEFQYKRIKYNVDLLNVIQLGLTFADEFGRTPEGTSTWQFNFKFDLNKDMYAEDSINFLQKNGLNFNLHLTDGIDKHDFGEIIMSSGLLMNQDIKWISFHGSYDFGYLLKILTCEVLPESECKFFALLREFFPALYDIKYLLKRCSKLPIRSLQKIADVLNVKRIGPQHQAGSDSLMTCQTFFKLLKTHLCHVPDYTQFSGILYGHQLAESTRLTSIALSVTEQPFCRQAFLHSECR